MSVNRVYPHPSWLEVPLPFQGEVTPILPNRGYPIPDWMVYPLAGLVRGTPVWTGCGYSLSGLDGGTLHLGQVLGGTPLRVSLEDFLVCGGEGLVCENLPIMHLNTKFCYYPKLSVPNTDRFYKWWKITLDNTRSISVAESFRRNNHKKIGLFDCLSILNMVYLLLVSWQFSICKKKKKIVVQQPKYWQPEQSNGLKKSPLWLPHFDLISWTIDNISTKTAFRGYKLLWIFK